MVEDQKTPKAGLGASSAHSTQILNDFKGILNIFRKEVFRYIVRSMSLGNHVPCALGIIRFAVFFFQIFQCMWLGLHKIKVEARWLIFTHFPSTILVMILSKSSAGNDIREQSQINIELKFY